MIGALSAVLPAHNEERNVESAVARCDAALRALGLDYELIVVDDVSGDGTGAILDQLVHCYPRLRVVTRSANPGYGAALRAGFAAARHDWIFFSHTDNQFDFKDLRLLLPFAPANDIVTGYRKPRRDPPMRRLNGWGWNVLIRLSFGSVVRDIDCGFKLFRRSLLEEVPLTSQGAMIDAELVVGAHARAARIREVNVPHYERTHGHATGAKPIVILRALRDLARYRIRLSEEVGQGRTRDLS